MIDKWKIALANLTYGRWLKSPRWKLVQSPGDLSRELLCYEGTGLSDFHNEPTNRAHGFVDDETIFYDVNDLYESPRRGYEASGYWLDTRNLD